MNIVCLGLSHRTASVEIRERFAVADPALDRALQRFQEVEGVREVVIVSTCNRVEFYASGERLVSGFHGLDHFLREHGGVNGSSREDLAAIYRYDAPHSVRHLFQVACGLDSMVLGETEILGQIKRAYALAAGSGATSGGLNKFFQRAFRVAKQVRTHTGINRGSVSVGSVAADLAGKIFGSLEACRVLVLGAGDTGERTARSLVSRGAGTLLVSNRSFERAEELARELGGQAVSFEDWPSHLKSLDILVTSTSAPHPILDRARLERGMRGRDDRPLFLIDLAVPRDVEPSVNELENVYLYDIDSLRDIASRSLSEREAELEVCRRIIDRHVDEFTAWMRTRAAVQGGIPARPVASGGLGTV